MEASLLRAMQGRQVLDEVFQGLARHSSYDDILLLPLIVLGSAYIYNKGSILPRRDPFHYKWYERPQEAFEDSKDAATGHTRNVAEKVQQTSADVVVFWGSQSGVAEGLAHRLARDFARRLKLVPLVADLSDYDPETLSLLSSSTIVVFVVSTFGEGEPSDNGRDFVAWLQSKERPVSLSQVRYAAFGCGNRNYRYYNKVVDDVVEAMSLMGAVALVPAGKGDEAARTTNEDFSEWKESLFAALVSKLGIAEHEAGYEPAVDVTEVASEAENGPVEMGDPLNRGIFARGQGRSSIVSVPVAVHRRIASFRKDTNRHCVHLEVSLHGHRQIKYRAGDHLAVWPSNPDAEVQALLSLLGLESKMSAVVRSALRGTSGSGGDAEIDEDLKVPHLTTIEALFRHYLEIGAPVSREVVLWLAELAPSSDARERLLAIGKDKQSYSQFLESNHVTLSRILQHAISGDPCASWTGLPLPFVVDALPAMKPRVYSISSSPVLSPRQISLTVAVKPTDVPGSPDISIPGLASTYLSASTEAARLHVQVRASTFKLPLVSTVPLVLVAAGTGIAPLRAFLQERAHIASVGRDVGSILFFFGCQTEDDFLYQEELRRLQSESLAGKLDIFTAYSRGDGPKKYVDHAVKQEAERVRRFLLDDDAAFYICGSTAMATSVREIVSKEVEQIKEWTEKEVEDWRQERKKSKRWFEDVWG